MSHQRQLAIRLLLVVFLVTMAASAIYELTLPGRYVSPSGQSVDRRVEMLVRSTDVLSDGWINSAQNSDNFLRQAWQIETPNQWREKGVSLYLVRSGEILFWANNTFSNPLSDSLILSESQSIVTIDSSQVLIFSQSKGELKAITVIELLSAERGCNRSIFGDTKVTVSTCSSLPFESAGTHSYTVMGKHFCVNYPIAQRSNLFISLLGWFGVFAALIAIVIYLSSHTKSRNAPRNMAIFGLSLIALRVVLHYVDFPQGASHSWSSIFSILISQLVLVVFMAYLYAIRRRFARCVARMSRRWQWVTLVGFTVAMSATIIFFHYSVVQVIFRSTVVLEIYNIFSMSTQGFALYLICAVFAAYRILYSLFSRIVFPQFKVYIRSILSMVTVSLMVIPISAELHQTTYFLIAFHALFVFISSRNPTQGESRIFVIDTIILSLYVSLLTSSDSAVAKVNDARKYAVELSQGNLETPAPYPDVIYSIISNREVDFNKGYPVDIGRIMQYSKLRTPEVKREQGYIHVIEPMADGVVVVSYPWVSILDLVALICYVFFGLYLVSGLFLRLSGVDVYDRRVNRTMAYRIRFIVIGIVFFSLFIVAWVVYQYSDVIYRIRQRELLNNSAWGMVESFSKYYADNSESIDLQQADNDSIIMDWYNNRGNAFSAEVTFYNVKGCRIGCSNAIFSSYRIDQDAYRSLSWQGAPYFDNYDHDRSYVYLSIFVDQKKVGYFVLNDRNEANNYSRYWLLGSIFNVFVVLLFVSLILSIIIYSYVGGPIQTLTHFLGGVGKLQKIPIKTGRKMQDEVGRLILQYNRMIDYLEESYAALSKFEREGAWKEMARQVAHEIKNPLTPMRLKIQMLQRARAQGDQKICDQLDSTLVVLLEQIDVLTKISSDFSDLARLEETLFSRMELNSIISNIVTLYTNNTPQIDIRFADTTTSAVWVSASYVSLSRLLVNLLQNASQAIECNGTIVVTLSSSASTAQIDIADNGRGIEPELLERIFEPNFTTRSNGSGLGLAMCRQIVESFNGTIRVNSTLCMGSTFTVTLPLYKVKE